MEYNKNGQIICELELSFEKKVVQNFKTIHFNFTRAILIISIDLEIQSKIG